MIKLMRYGQITTTTETLSGRTIGQVMKERRMGVEYYSYPAWPTYAQAQVALVNHTREATDRRFTIYDSGIKANDNGTFTPWLKLIPPSDDTPQTLYDTWTFGKTGVDATLFDEKAIEEEKTSIWPWALVGGGALVLLVIAGVAMSKK